LLEISLGSDDGLEKGAVVRLFHAGGGMYLGTAEVAEIRADRAVCRPNAGKRYRIVKGDRVVYELPDLDHP
jgi:hypothetical protein